MDKLTIITTVDKHQMILDLAEKLAELYPQRFNNFAREFPEWQSLDGLTSYPGWESQLYNKADSAIEALLFELYPRPSSMRESITADGAVTFKGVTY